MTLTREKCPGCLSSNSFDELKSTSYPILKPAPKGVRTPKSIEFCSQCGLGIANPIFTEQEEQIIYDQGEYWKESKCNVNLHKISLPLTLARHRWAFIKKNYPSPLNELKILDIGCGQGAMGITAAQDKKGSLSDYVGIEPDPRLQQDLQSLWKNLSIKPNLTLTSRLEDVNELNMTFDIIVFSHIVEHVREPLELFEKLNPFMNNHTAIFVDVPHKDYLFKPDVFPHVLFFSPSSLEQLLTRAGFTPKEIKIFGQKRDINPIGKNASLTSKFLNRVVAKFSTMIPLFMLRWYYDFMFKGNKEDERGIWLRAVAFKKN